MVKLDARSLAPKSACTVKLEDRSFESALRTLKLVLRFCAPDFLHVKDEDREIDPTFWITKDAERSSEAALRIVKEEVESFESLFLRVTFDAKFAAPDCLIVTLALRSFSPVF